MKASHLDFSCAIGQICFGWLEVVFYYYDRDMHAYSLPCASPGVTDSYAQAETPHLIREGHFTALSIYLKNILDSNSNIRPPKTTKASNPVVELAKHTYIRRVGKYPATMGR